MNKHFFCCIKVIALTLVGAMPLATLHAQSAPPPSASPSLQEQLEAQYPLAKITNAGGCSVTNPETALVLQKAGIGALPIKGSTGICSTHYKEGKINPPGFWCKKYLESAKLDLVTLESGDKVFATKLEVNANKSEIKVSIGYCAQATSYRADLIFQFPKKFLDTASVTQVEDKMAEVFSQDRGNQQPPGGPQSGGGDNTEQQAPDNQAAPEPLSVEIGQTLDQVVSALGEPDTKAKGAGTKQIYVYRERKLKIIFVDGKVADIE